MSIPPPESDRTPQARRWVEEARKLHQPSRLAAGEYEDGTCAYCTEGASFEGQPPVERYRDYLHGARTKCWMHDHPDSWPHCNTCAAGYDDRADFPCSTAIALGWVDGAYR